MQQIVATFFLLLTAVFAAIEVEEGVLVLNDANFDEAVAQNDILLVEFYAPWCGHCKSLAPEYAKAATALADSPAKLAKIDATANKEQGEKHGIRGFPTLKFFRNGKVSEYNGGRTSSEIVNWMNKKSGPATKAVTTEADLDALKEAHDAFVLGLFDAAESAAAKAFTNMAAADDNNVYAMTTSTEVKGKLAVTTETVVVLKSFDEKRNDLSVASGFDDAAVEAFIAGATTPLIQTFSQESAKKIFASPVKNHMLFFTDAGHEHHDPTVATFRTLAEEFKNRALFVNVPHHEQRVLDFFGITREQLPTLVLAEMAEDAMKKYPFPDALSADGVRTFLDDFFGGKLSPTLKSEEPEPADTKGPVVVVRGKTFADIVLNNDKDVLVEFYAPWCGHCKKLAPVYDEVAERVQSNSNLVIAKMDATANEVNVKNLSVKGYPTLVFFKGNDKTHPIRYEGGREADDFVAYLKANAHHPVSVEDEL